MSDGAGLAIRTEDLRKTYKSSRGDVPAVRGIDLSVGSGQFFGLLGPNGAGKSTTIGMLTTLVLPTAGRAWVAGPRWREAFGFVDPADEPVIRKFFVDMIDHFGEQVRKERGR